MKVLLAGATGSVGSALLQLLNAAGHETIALCRDPGRARRIERFAAKTVVGDVLSVTLDLDGVDAAVSTLGAPVTLRSRERRRYREVDFGGNRRILAAVRQAGLSRFVYLSVHLEEAYSQTAYIRAHEDFVGELEASGLSSTIVRPTGIFPAFNDFVALARQGAASVVGDGSARTNPVSEWDVAETIFRNLESGPKSLSLGGPDILTRREIAELAFHALGRSPRIVNVSPWLFRYGARMAGLWNPRLGELFEFLTAVSTADSIAPQLGTRRLIDHFRSVASAVS